MYSIATGDKTDEVITLNNRVFGMPIREDILHRVVVWQVYKGASLTCSWRKDVKDLTV